MSSKKSILMAFLLNFFFAIFEFFGGLLSKSVAIMSDALHDAGDALSIGLSYFLERKSEKKPSADYTFGYRRYSVLGALITTLILTLGSLVVIVSSIMRMFKPMEVNYDGMIILAIFGCLVNFLGVYFTHEGENLNKKAVNLHLLEDVLGWIVVLIGAIVIKFTKFYLIDPLMSLGVALFILVSALKNLKEVFDLFLEKTPEGITVNEVKKLVKTIEGVKDVHHIHLWSMDGEEVYATMHIVSDKKKIKEVKTKVKDVLKENNISHTTIEMEEEGEVCHEEKCEVKKETHHHHH